jgi:hypothetical protein
MLHGADHAKADGRRSNPLDLDHDAVAHNDVKCAVDDDRGALPGDLFDRTR